MVGGGGRGCGAPGAPDRSRVCEGGGCMSRMDQAHHVSHAARAGMLARPHAGGGRGRVARTLSQKIYWLGLPHTAGAAALGGGTANGGLPNRSMGYVEHASRMLAKPSAGAAFCASGSSRLRGSARRRAVRVRAMRQAAAQRARPCDSGGRWGPPPESFGTKHSSASSAAQQAACCRRHAHARLHSAMGHSPAASALCAQPALALCAQLALCSLHSSDIGRTCLRSRQLRRRSACGTPQRASPGGC